MVTDQVIVTKRGRGQTTHTFLSVLSHIRGEYLSTLRILESKIPLVSCQRRQQRLEHAIAGPPKFVGAYTIKREFLRFCQTGYPHERFPPITLPLEFTQQDLEDLRNFPLLRPPPGRRDDSCKKRRDPEPRRPGLHYRQSQQDRYRIFGQSYLFLRLTKRGIQQGVVIQLSFSARKGQFSPMHPTTATLNQDQPQRSISIPVNRKKYCRLNKRII